MKTLMRYRIKSGRVMEIRDVLMDISLDQDRKARPRGKRRGKTLAAQVERNMREAERQLARTLNCNFGAGDLFLTLKYDDARLPADKDAAKRELRNFIRRMARAYQRETGRKLRWVAVTADTSSKTGLPVRLHHHLVLDPVAWELIAKHWPDDQFSYRRLDGAGDYTAVARYMIRNAGYHRGERSWSNSQGLAKPVYSAPVPVKGERVVLPKGARVVERLESRDMDSGFYGGYIRCVVPDESGSHTGDEGRAGSSRPTEGQGQGQGRAGGQHGYLDTARRARAGATDDGNGGGGA